MSLAHPPPIARRETGVLPNALWVAVARTQEISECTTVLSWRRLARPPPARYGTLIAWAKTLGRADCAQVLQQNLAEEKAADEKLTTIAESNVNRAAA